MVRKISIGVAALLAIATFTAAVVQIGVTRSSPIQIRPAENAPMVPMQTLSSQMPPMAEPFYVPLASAASLPQNQAAGAAAQPIVYYYVPAQPSPQSLITPSLAAAANATNASSAARGNGSSCEGAGLAAVAKPYIEAWEACKADTKPKAGNTTARRMLLNWVWEGKGKPTSPKPSWRPRTSGTTILESEGDMVAKCQKNLTDQYCPMLDACPYNTCISNMFSDENTQRMCGLCTFRFSAGWGCFAHDAKVGDGSVSVVDLKVGDAVTAAAKDGSIVSSRIYYIHDHKRPAPTVILQHSNGDLELSPMHMVPVYTAACGAGFCANARMIPAHQVSVGDKIYVASSEGSAVQGVTGVKRGVSYVRYVLTEAETIVVGGVVASVHSTAGGALETLPFRALDAVWKGVLQSEPVAAALATVLESPILESIEAVLDSVVSIASKHLAGRQAGKLEAYFSTGFASVA